MVCESKLAPAVSQATSCVDYHGIWGKIRSHGVATVLGSGSRARRRLRVFTLAASSLAMRELVPAASSLAAFAPWRVSPNP
jgi:hypothetical protein